MSTRGSFKLQHQSSSKDDKYVPIQKPHQHVAKPPFLTPKRGDKLSKLTNQNSIVSLSNTNSNINQNDYYKFDDNDDEFKNDDSNGHFELVHYAEPIYDEFLAKLQKLSTQKTLKNQLHTIEPKQKFISYLIEAKLHELVKELFESKLAVYEPNEAKNCCRILCDKARIVAKSFKLDRYKYVVNTFVMQKRGQSATIASRSLFCMTTDSYASQKYETKDYVVICIVYAVYHE